MSKQHINLPKTAFSMKANLPTREPEFIKFWDKINLYQKLRDKTKGFDSKISSNERRRFCLCTRLGLSWFAN